MGKQYGYMEVIGAKIREARVTAGVTQDVLGRSVGLDCSAISRIENGKRETLDINTVKKIAEYLGVDMSRLV